MKITELTSIFIFLFFLCANNVNLADETIIIAGTGDSVDILQILSFEFIRNNPGVKIILPDSVGSGGGIKLVYEGKAGLGRIAREIKDGEKKYGLNHVWFAYSPVVFVVNFSGKGIDNITYQNIVDIYSGKIAFWNEMGGGSRKIYVANREDGDSSRLILEKIIPGFKTINTFAGKILYSTQEAADVLVKYKDTIGFIPLSIAIEKNLNVLKVNGTYPSVENVKNKSYNLTTLFGIVWKGELAGKSKLFVDYLFSRSAGDIMVKHGTVPAER
ncbi:MAG: substrate-binding domain-containing protein [bacterium]